MKYDLCIVIAAQTNRSGHDKTSIGLADVADSFGINYTADTVFSLSKNEITGHLILTNSKNRDGACNKKIAMDVDFGKMTYTEADDHINSDPIESPEQEARRRINPNEFATFHY